MHTSKDENYSWFHSLSWPKSSDWHSINVPLSELPRETRVICVLRGSQPDKVIGVHVHRGLQEVPAPALQNSAIEAKHPSETFVMLPLQSSSWTPLAWVAVRLYDHSGYLNTGKQLLGMWMVRLIFVLHTPLMIPAVPPRLRVPKKDQISCFPFP